MSISCISCYFSNQSIDPIKVTHASISNLSQVSSAMTLSSTKQLLSKTLLPCTLIAIYCADWIKNTITTMSEYRIMVWQYFANHCAWMYLVEESAGRNFGTAPSSVWENLLFQMLLLRVRGKRLFAIVSLLLCIPAAYRSENDSATIESSQLHIRT